MNNIDYLASRGVANGMQLDNYGWIYYQTNEDLIDMYKQLDFKDKEVLSVMASGDQVFTAQYLGAKKVDAFDKNKLVLYYYYLRLWSIKYMNQLYPIIDSRRWMYNLLKKVKVKSRIENDVRIFFYKHLNENTNLNKLFYNINDQPDGKTLFSDASDLKLYTNNPVNFFVIDMFLKINIDSKYDIIIMSNILEWSKGNKDLIMMAKNNIDSLLKENGKVLCSSLVNNNMDLLEGYICDKYTDGLVYTKKK